MTLRVLNVNDSLDLVTGGGAAERTFQMSLFLSKQGVFCNVLTLDSNQLSSQRIKAISPARVFVLSCIFRRFNIPKIDWGTIKKLVNEADIIHLMGHWSILNALVYLAIRRLDKNYVVCPAGALPLYGRSKWLKRFYNYMIGNAIVRNASGWIAVTDAELPQFEAYGVNASLVTIIPNGVSEQDFPEVNISEFRIQHGLPNAKIILFMGRLNIIKGPDLLLEAFLMAKDTLSEYHLVFAGPDGGMMMKLREKVERAGLGNCIHFLGYVGGADKSALYHMASLLVVPSRQEAMSIVALEAGVCGLPVLLTDQCGFSEIRSVDARLEVPASIAGIANGLTNLLANPKCLKKLAPVWSSFVNRNYSLTFLTSKYVKLYEDIIASVND